MGVEVKGTARRRRCRKCGREKNFSAFATLNSRVCRLCRHTPEEQRLRDAQRKREDRDAEVTVLHDGEPLTWLNAQRADGPKVVDWMNANLPPFHPDSSAARRKWDWERGATASFYALDRIMVSFDRHISEIPDYVWTEFQASHDDREHLKESLTPNGRGQPVELRSCAAPGCKNMIPYRRKDGHVHGPKKYSQLKYCSIPCSYSALSGNGVKLRKMMRTA